MPVLKNKKKLLLAVDPGVINCGVALFEGKELRAAWLSQALEWAKTAQAVRMGFWEHTPDDFFPGGEFGLAIEIPQIYTGAKQKGRQSDLINLTLVAGMILGSFHDLEPSYQHFQPRTWKGAVPKQIMNDRVHEKLSVAERKRIVLPKKKSLSHNILDAVGIGLHALKRL